MGGLLGRVPLNYIMSISFQSYCRVATGQYLHLERGGSRVGEKA